MSDADTKSTPTHFIRQIIDQDLADNRYQEVVTRFPPEPNGYLHVGHVKSICLNFGLAQNYNSRCHLRFDDTNPVKEDQEYIDAIKEDIRWLGFDWAEHEYYASDYFEQLYDWAVKLINDGKAYVCDLNGDQIREMRGSLTTPGTESPHRNRTPEENLDLFKRMRDGEFKDGEKVLRAKIDMASPNINLRDPVMYRILHAHHHRAGDKWCIYPTYDYTHGQSDSIEGITHSICTLEFEDHRPLYNWYIEQLGIHHPRQIEFARLNIEYMVMSKRKLLQLVNENIVSGWDDPRMPTVSGMRRRGYPAAALRDFCEGVGVAKREHVIEFSRLEHAVRTELNKVANRIMAVLDPIKVVITNYPDDQVEYMDAVNNPEDESAGTRKVPFTQELYIEREDFMEDPPKKFFRLGPGREVRLRYGYWITCTDFIKDDDGNITEIRATYDPKTRGGNNPPDGRKVKGTLHWVSAVYNESVEVRLYDHLLTQPNPNALEEGQTFLDIVNTDSRSTVKAIVEPAINETKPGDFYQFERVGYFCTDPDTTDDQIVMNRTTTLRDSWAKQKKKK